MGFHLGTGMRCIHKLTGDGERHLQGAWAFAGSLCQPLVREVATAG
jgi:hypothetical protein